MAKFEKTKAVKTDRRTVRVIGRASFLADRRTSILVNGQMQPVDKIIDVSEAEARDFIARGLVVDATEAEATEAGTAIVVAPVLPSASWTDAV